MYTSEAALTDELHAGDQQTILSIQLQLSSLAADLCIACPLALGSHMEHQLTQAAAEALQVPLWYYAAYPYVLRDRHPLEQMAEGWWIRQAFDVSPKGISTWQESIAAHASQVSTIWVDTGKMKQAISYYVPQEGGVRLWKKLHE
jgi:hypothetical protein